MQNEMQSYTVKEQLHIPIKREFNQKFGQAGCIIVGELYSKISGLQSACDDL